MDNKIKIGIPRGLFYYKYNVLWRKFFEELDCDILISPETNYDIINSKNFCNNEICLPLKIFIGHINYLKDKVDYTLIANIDKINDEICCPYYNMLYDIVNNYLDVNIIGYKINEKNLKVQEREFIKIGEKLGFSKNFTLNAYHKAKIEEYKQNKIRYLIQQKKLTRNKLKILLIGQKYIIYDSLIGYKIIQLLNKQDCEIIFIDDIINDYNNDKSFEEIYKGESSFITLSNNFNKNKFINGIIYININKCNIHYFIKNKIHNDISLPSISILFDEEHLNNDYFKEISKFIDDIKGDVYE